MASRGSSSRTNNGTWADIEKVLESSSGSSVTFKKPTNSSSKNSSSRQGSKGTKHSSSPATEASHRSGGSRSSSHRTPVPRYAEKDERRKEIKDDEAYELNIQLDENSARLDRMERNLKELDTMLSQKKPRKTKHPKSKKGH